MVTVRPEKFITLMLDFRLNKRGLARKMHSTQATVDRIVSGQPLSHATQLALWDAFGRKVPLDEFLCVTEGPGEDVSARLGRRGVVFDEGDYCAMKKDHGAPGIIYRVTRALDDGERRIVRADAGDERAYTVAHIDNLREPNVGELDRAGLLPQPDPAEDALSFDERDALVQARVDARLQEQAAGPAPKKDLGPITPEKLAAAMAKMPPPDPEEEKLSDEERLRRIDERTS